MKTNLIYALGGAALAVCTAACSAPRATTTEPSVVIGGGQAPAVECVEFDSTTMLRMGDLPPSSAVPGHPLSGRQAAIPRARVYRMNGDYADNVPVGTDGNGRIISYPAPTDLSTASKPIQLAGGWWLDRRGVGRRGGSAMKKLLLLLALTLLAAGLAGCGNSSGNVAVPEKPVLYLYPEEEMQVTVSLVQNKLKRENFPFFTRLISLK